MMAPLHACKCIHKKGSLEVAFTGAPPAGHGGSSHKESDRLPKHTDLENELIVLGLKFRPQLRTLLDPEDPSDGCGNRCPKGLASGSGTDDFRFLHLSQKMHGEPSLSTIYSTFAYPTSKVTPFRLGIRESESSRGERLVVVNARGIAPGG